jgi:gluconolactonase
MVALPTSAARLVADGLGFVEGPVALLDGTLLVVDLRHSCVWTIGRDGSKHQLLKTPGGLNGAALGPDGRLYVCNNGGIDWADDPALNVPLGRSRSYIGGRIQAIELQSGRIEDLYTSWRGVPLRAPNDLVFDQRGGFYFTDHASAFPDMREHGGLYYARPDGSYIERLAYPLNHPNGVALSPGENRIYVGDSLVGNLWSWDIEDTGKLAAGPHIAGARFLSRLPDVQVFDSIAVDVEGNIVCATLHPSDGNITVINPDGRIIGTVHLPDSEPYVTNVCFGGADSRTVYVTSGSRGRVYAFDWPIPGLRLNFA